MRRRDVMGGLIGLGLAAAATAPAAAEAIPTAAGAIAVRARRRRGARGALVAFHGVGRDADAMLEAAATLADALGLELFAPLMDARRFPTWRYQRGGVTRDGVLQPRGRWTAPIAAEIVAWTRARAAGPVFLFGHSAGGQFLSRVAAYGPEAVEGVARIVIANPSGHAAPTLDAAPAYGFAGLYAGAAAEAALRRHLAMPITIFLGRDDLGDEDLVTSPAAMRQGRNRLERGRRVFAEAKTLAERRGWPFGWRKVEARGVGHSAAEMLASGRAKRALQPRDSG